MMKTGAMRAVQRQHQIKHTSRRLPVQVASCRLIRQHTGRIGHQRTRDGGTLTFATGKPEGVWSRRCPSPTSSSMAAA